MSYGQRDEYENGLRALGCQCIGNGLYSNVFAIPNTDKVIKVAEMDRWPEYISWATRNGYAGKFAPKVYSLKFKSDFYVAVMERLVCTIKQIKYRQDGSWNEISCDQLELFNKATAWGYDGDKDDATEFMAFIRAMRAARLTGDLHDGNAMVRHDGQLVVTDPCSGSFSSSQYRIRKGALSDT